jgi:CHASE1-domain containing sensor protein
LSKFELQRAIDDDSTLMVTSSALQVQMDNWIDFVIHKVKTQTEDVKSNLNASEFIGKVHGAALTTDQA